MEILFLFALAAVGLAAMMRGAVAAVPPEPTVGFVAVSGDEFGGASAPVIDISTPTYEPVFADEFGPADLGVTNGTFEGNLAAFLAVIRQGESANNYSALVYGGNFADFSDHPFETGEFTGVRRADGRLTTAAGAYQIVKTTWKSLGGKQRFGDFSPSAQDAAAVELLKGRGAYNLVLDGRAVEASAKLGSEWEMFKTARWPASRVAAVFTGNGGFLA